MFGWLGGSTDRIVEVIKQVIVKILKWIWDKIKDWIMDHWERAALVLMGLVIWVLVKLLVLKVQLTPIFDHGVI